jgi:hypothetical protein
LKLRNGDHTFFVERFQGKYAKIPGFKVDLCCPDTIEE